MTQKCYGVLKKNAILSATANDERGRQRKPKEKNSYRYFKRKNIIGEHSYLSYSSSREPRAKDKQSESIINLMNEQLNAGYESGSVSKKSDEKN